jgi:hypothetical protein
MNSVLIFNNQIETLKQKRAILSFAIVKVRNKVIYNRYKNPQYSLII